MRSRVRVRAVLAARSEQLSRAVLTARWKMIVTVLILGAAFAGTTAYRAQAQAPAAAPPVPAGPVHVITFVDITPDNRAKGTDLCKQYAADTRKDPGVTRAELLAQSNRPNHLVLDVVFQDQAAFERHVQAAHTKDFRNKMGPIIGAPFDERLHYVVP